MYVVLNTYVPKSSESHLKPCFTSGPTRMINYPIIKFHRGYLNFSVGTRKWMKKSVPMSNVKILFPAKRKYCIISSSPFSFIVFLGLLQDDSGDQETIRKKGRMVGEEEEEEEGEEKEHWKLAHGRNLARDSEDTGGNISLRKGVKTVNGVRVFHFSPS